MTGDEERRGLSARIAAGAPIDPALAAALARVEHLALTDLQSALGRSEAGLREWARDPANRGRPAAESPGHLDRVALGMVVEYRTLGG